MIGCRRVLHDRGAALLLDGADAGRPVEPRAREDHADRALLERGGHRLEEQIDGRPREVDQLGAGERHVALRHQEVVVGRRDVDRAGTDRLVVVRLLHGHLRVPPEQIGEQALVARVEVLDDEHRRAEAPRQSADHRLERRHPAGRGADGDCIERGVLHRDSRSCQIEAGRERETVQRPPRRTALLALV